MKKSKILTPIISLASLSSVIIPLTTLTSCAKSAAGNLMEEYTPTLGTMERRSFASADDAIVEYLKVIETTPEIFIQDLKYTLSRGMPEYLSYISKFCEIKDHNFNMEIDKDTVKVDYSNKRTVTFEATFDILFDYTGTKYDEMVWYDISTYRWDTKTKIKFVFDFDTKTFTEVDPLSARRQMTTIAGATQFGISELNSTAQLLSETGSYIDLNNIEHKVEINEPKQAAHFILPDEEYWRSKEGVSYDEKYAEVANVWYTMPGVQSIILMLKYYMGTDTHDCYAPSVLDFGSYFMSKATLDDVYTFADLDDTAKTCALYGFNLSLDSINNIENINTQLSGSSYDSETKTLMFPSEYKEQYDVVEISAGAFDSAQSLYTNLGLPNIVENIILPSSITSYSGMAVASSTSLKTIKFEHGTNDPYPSFAANAFFNLNNVNLIDFSSWKDSDINDLKVKYLGSQCFENIHYKLAHKDKIYGHIKVPSDNVGWKEIMSSLGFKIYDSTVADSEGWQLDYE